MTIEEWNDFIGSRYNSPISALYFDDSTFDPVNPPQLYHNSTIFTNCNRQHSLAFNPSHLMMSIGWLYELSNCALRNFGRKRLFKHDILLPFQHFVLHQCPNPNKSYWMWGKTVLQAVQEKLGEAMLIRRNQSEIIRRGKESNSNEIMCFDDLYLSARSSRWIEGSE